MTAPAAGQWASLGPDGGWVNVLVLNPETPSTLYAGTIRGGVFKSTDAGASWTAMNSGIPLNQSALQIQEMAIDPVTPEILYIGTGGTGVFKSTDGAHSWAAARQGLTDNVIEALAVDPSNPSTLYAGTGGRGVFKSSDAANSWTMVLDGGGLGRANALAVAPSNSSIVYLGAGFNSLYKSTDAGDTWNLFNTGLDDASVFNEITVHPTNPDIVYAATDNGLFKTTNGGDSWSVLNTPVSVVESVVLDPSNSATVYATSDAVIKSTDSGDSWIEQDDDLFAQVQVHSIAIDPDDPLTLYAGGNGFEGLFKSSNGGTDWVVSNPGIRNLQINSIAFDSQDPSIIYTGAGRGGVYKSTDGGQTWESKQDSNLSGFTQIRDILVDPVNPLNVYVGTEFAGGIFWSNDGAETWNAANVLGIVYELGGSIQPILRLSMRVPAQLFPRAPTRGGTGHWPRTVSPTPSNTRLWLWIPPMVKRFTPHRVPGSAPPRMREYIRPPTEETPGRNPVLVLRSRLRFLLWRSIAGILPLSMRAGSAGYSKRVRTPPPAG